MMSMHAMGWSSWVKARVDTWNLAASERGVSPCTRRFWGQLPAHLEGSPEEVRQSARSCRRPAG